MAQRLLILSLEKTKAEKVTELFADDVHILWAEDRQDRGSQSGLVVEAEHSEDILEQIGQHFEGEYQVVLLNIEARLPKSEEEEERERKQSKGRVSRGEVYNSVKRTIDVGWRFVLLTTLAAIIGAVGMAQDNLAVIIGSMVIAPLLGPNVAVALGLSLADWRLAWKAVWVNASSLLIAFALAFASSYFLNFEVATNEILSRSNVNITDILVGLAAGVAGALAFTSSTAGAIVGVTVAVALLPPLIAAGMLFGAGYWESGLGALLLFGSTIIALNLSAIATFLLQGITPFKRQERPRARLASYLALAAWLLLLIALAVIIINTDLQSSAIQQNN